jgi:GNAT superfamily N-acetyltransferase
MDVFLFEPPEKGFDEELIWFQRHRSEQSLRRLSSIAKGKYLSEISNCYFIGKINGEFAAMLWYSYGNHDSSVSNFGEVYTAPEHRQKGITKILMRYFKKSFDESPAMAAFCTCSREWIVAIYREFGFFQAISGTSGGPLMLKGKANANSLEDFENEYFSNATQLEVLPASMAYRHEADCLLKFVLMQKGIGKNRCFASDNILSYLGALFMAEDGKGKVFMALTPDKRFAGWSFFLEPFYSPPEETVPVFDFELYPGYSDLAEKFIRDSFQSAGRGAITFCMQGDDEKITLLKKSGFKEQSRIAKYSQNKDLLILERR